MSEQESAYRSLRHFCPDVVRDLRLALDCGATAAALKKSLQGRHADLAVAAIDWLVANPRAGAVRWTTSEQYTWVDLEG